MLYVHVWDEISGETNDIALDGLFPSTRDAVSINHHVCIAQGDDPSNWAKNQEITLPGLGMMFTFKGDRGAISTITVYDIENGESIETAERREWSATP